MTSGLIVNADDFGLTQATSRAIEHAHRSGIATSTSVLAVAPAATASLRALDAPDLDVGVHLALVGEDPPLLSAAEVPSLVDRSGRLASSWRVLLGRAPRMDPAEIEREMRAQVDLVRRAGFRPTHLDPHQHVHLLPRIAEAVVRVAVAEDIEWVRIPEPRQGGPRSWALDRLARRLRSEVAASGRRAPDRFAGIEDAGHLDPASLRRRLQDLAAGSPTVVEVNVHPGPANDPDRIRYRWGYGWADELAALVDPATADACHAAGLRLGRRRDM
ncbi:MAG: ChbG/HpnK family deacetylase [Iamia sp.]